MDRALGGDHLLRNQRAKTVEPWPRTQSLETFACLGQQLVGPHVPPFPTEPLGELSRVTAAQNGIDISSTSATAEANRPVP